MASPLNLIKEANKAYPASNLVWIAIALAAAVAVISALDLGITTLVAGGAVILAAIVLYTAVAMFHKALSSIENIPGARILAGVIAWSFTLLIVGFFLGMFTAFFFGVPQTLERLFRLAPLVEETQQVEAQQDAPELGEVQTTTEPVTPVGPVDPPTGDGPEDRTADCVQSVDPALEVAEFRAQIAACLALAEDSQ